MKCTNCGNEIPNDAAFCSFCGASQANQTSSVDKTISSFNTSPIPNQQENKSQYSSPNPLPNQNQNQYGNNFVPNNDTKNKSNTALKIIIPIVAFVLAMIIGVAVLPNLLKSNSDDDDNETSSSLYEDYTDEDDYDDDYDDLEDEDSDFEFKDPERPYKKSDEEIIEEYLEKSGLNQPQNIDIQGTDSQVTMSTKVSGNSVTVIYKYDFSMNEKQVNAASDALTLYFSKNSSAFDTIKNECPQIDTIFVEAYTADDTLIYTSYF